jgi:hypothetical protein
MTIEVPNTPHPTWSASLEAFASMVKKQLIIMTRYPINFVTSFVQIFIIILMFAFAALMFNPGGVELGGESGQTGGVMMFGFVLFMFLTSWGDCLSTT